MSKSNTTEPVTFRGSIPQIESAIKLHGESGARLQIDIPDQYIGEFIPIIRFRGKLIKVTIEDGD